jgi:hypothetical protein
MSNGKSISYGLRDKRTGETVEPTRWGDWQLDRERLVLVNEREDYEVDLEDCLTAERTLDWIIQISSKGWGTNDCVGSLVAALRDLIDPQNTQMRGRDIAPNKIKGVVANREVETLAGREWEDRHRDDEQPAIISAGDLASEHDELVSVYEVVDV